MFVFLFLFFDLSVRVYWNASKVAKDARLFSSLLLRFKAPFVICHLSSGQEKRMAKSLPCYKHNLVPFKEALAKEMFGNTAVCERYESPGLTS